MSRGEMYPSAPLALVAAEVRYPAVADKALGMAIHRRIRDALDLDWVIHNDIAQTFQAGLDAAGPHASLRSESVSRIASRQRTRMITTGPESFIVEVTDYADFQDFRELIACVATAIRAVLSPDGISRVGLRYIDEIAVPQTNPEWERWLVSSLMPPILPTGPVPNGLLPTGPVPTEWTGAVHYRLAPEHALVLRYGPSAQPVVSPSGPLKRLKVPEGPIFTLDFDGSWQPDGIPEFTTGKILETMERLRSPVRALFDSLLKPDLLDVFRKDSPT